MKPKAFYSSKTLMFNTVVSAVAVHPYFHDFVSAHSDLFFLGVAVGNIALRFVTKQSISIKVLGFRF